MSGQNTVVAKVTNGSGVTGTSNAINFNVDPAQFYISPNAPTVQENQGQLVFTLTRAGDMTPRTVFVQTNDTFGTANTNNRYFQADNLVAVYFAQNVTTATVPITINDIHQTSGSQTFGVSIYDKLNTNDTPLASTTFTIVDTDTNTGTLSGDIVFDDTRTGTTTIAARVDIYASTTLTNNGVMDVNPGAYIGDIGGILSNSAGSYLNINTNDPSQTLFDIGQLNNSGTIVASVPSGSVATITTVGGNINDTGSVDVLSGTLRLFPWDLVNYSQLNASGISVASGAAIEFDGTTRIAGGTYRVAGTTVIGNANYVGNVVFGAGTTVDLGSSWDLCDGTLDLSKATLTGSFSKLVIEPNFYKIDFGMNNITINNLSSGVPIINNSGVTVHIPRSGIEFSHTVAFGVGA